MRGIVVCVDPRAAEAGARVLEAGGNAFDAAVATAFVQMITLPYSCGVAGMMTANLYTSHTGDHLVIDGCMRAGSLATEDMWAEGYLGEAAISGTSLFEDRRSTMGYTSICTPGAVAVLGKMQARCCTMQWDDLLQPAIEVAKRGFTVGPDLRTSMTTPSLTPHEPDAFTRIATNGPSAAIFLTPDGEAHMGGAIIRNPDYAATLEQLAASGPDDIYRGELARAIAADLQRNGSFITAADLAEYRPTEYAPLSTTYRGYQVYTNSAPGAGPLLIEALNVVGGMGLDSMSHGSRRTSRSRAGRHRGRAHASGRGGRHAAPDRSRLGRQRYVDHPQPRQHLGRDNTWTRLHVQQRHEPLRPEARSRKLYRAAQGPPPPDDAEHGLQKREPGNGLWRTRW